MTWVVGIKVKYITSHLLLLLLLVLLLLHLLLLLPLLLLLVLASQLLTITYHHIPSPGLRHGVQPTEGHHAHLEQR